MDMQADIRREERDGRGRYMLAMADGQDAYLTFRRAGADHILIDYSFVPPPFRGRGVAAMLVLRAVQDARETGTKITPVCGYVAAEFRRHKQWADVLAVGSK
jgi:predicted GNAT family acetyltransferase